MTDSEAPPTTEPTAAPSMDSLVEQARDHLERGVAAESDSEARYRMRAALQALELRRERAGD